MMSAVYKQEQEKATRNLVFKAVIDQSFWFIEITFTYVYFII